MANMTFKTNLLPNSTTLEYSLGSSTQKWNVYGNLIGNADTATKLGTSTVGSSSQPIYLDAGAPTAVNSKDTCNAFINALGVGDSNPVDADYYVSQYVNGGTTNTTYYRRPMSCLWGYIKAKTPLYNIGTAIPSNTNINTYNKTNNSLGLYYSNDSVVSGTLTNTPMTSSGYRLIAMQGYGDKRGHQIAWGTSATPYLRTENGTAGTFGDWAKLAYVANGTAVGNSTTPAYFTADGKATACTAYSGLFTAMSWTGGTTAGPTLSVTVGGTNKTATIPTATASASGAVTTGDQTWAGNKTLTRASGGDLAWRVTNSDTTLMLRLLIGSGKSNHGIYSNGYVNSSGTFTSSSTWIIYRGADMYVHCGTRLYGAVWNDYAEYRETKEKIQPGRCVCEIGDGTLVLTTKRLQKGCEIVSDTFGFAIGKSKKCQTPTAASGRVLAYCLEGQEEAKKHIGDPVCSGPNGTVSIMSHDEEKEWPSRIIGTISEIPTYDIWIANEFEGDTKEEIKVDGRIWIRIR